MTKITIKDIQSTADVKVFFSQMTDTFGLNWHIEDDFNSYQLNKSEADKINSLIDKSYDVCDDENLICSLALESTNKLRQEAGLSA